MSLRNPLALFAILALVLATSACTPKAEGLKDGDCGDDVDNDKDGSADCADSDCESDRSCQEQSQAQELTRMRSSVRSNLNAIRTAQKSYHHEWDAFTSAAATPATGTGKNAMDFTGGGYSAFRNFGWTPDGQVHCQYAVEAKNTAAAATDDFSITATCDLDGDGTESQITASRHEEAKLVTAENVCV